MWAVCLVVSAQGCITSSLLWIVRFAGLRSMNLCPGQGAVSLLACVRSGAKVSSPVDERMLEGSGKVVKEGALEKHSNGLLQLWKKKRCLLTEEGLLVPLKLLEPAPQGAEQMPPTIKQPHFSHMKMVDCVEHKGKYLYFTVVMSGGCEVDFHRPQDQGWNAKFTLQIVQYKNRQAILAVKSSPPATISSTWPSSSPRGACYYY